MSYQEVHCSKRIMRFGLPVITALGILMGSTTLAAAQELPAVCDTDPAVCNLTAEQVNTIRLCEKMGEDSEACETAWQETTLPATCDTDPASCDLTAEEVKAIRVCEANPEVMKAILKVRIGNLMRFLLMSAISAKRIRHTAIILGRLSSLLRRECWRYLLLKF